MNQTALMLTYEHIRGDVVNTMEQAEVRAKFRNQVREYSFVSVVGLLQY